VFKLFGDGRFLDAEIEDWVLETWVWLLTNFGGVKRLRDMRLVLASREFFPPTDAKGHDLALYLFDLVKLWMGLKDWPAKLEAWERREAFHRVGTYAALRRETEIPNGTFRIEDGEVIISYATDLVAEPRQLIATLSHELAHYLLARARQPIPGGNHLHEFATELVTVYCGFGLFRANAAFTFQQHHDSYGHGWRSSHSGYFSERTWAFALAIFAALREEELPADQVKRSVADLTRQAQRYLKRHDTLLEPLRAVSG
jgi:hypothetical protein